MGTICTWIASTTATRWGSARETSFNAAAIGVLLRVECMFPAEEVTEARHIALVGDAA
jgi:hypothetical protein